MPNPQPIAAASCLAAAIALGTMDGAAAAPPDRITTLEQVQVSASRTPHDPREVAAAVSVVPIRGHGRDSLGATVAEQLVGVPGVLARSRQNFAQDEQLSIRGFGTRASFGIRSVRLYVDGIPATMPDGQGQLSHFPLMDAARIEVLRGPFSALYGNAAGGVVQLFTVDGVAPGEIGTNLAVGSFDSRRVSAELRDARGDLAYVAGLNHFASAGYREHSRAERTLFHGKTTLSRGATKLTLIANALAAPNAQDPLGLDRAQFAADPQQATAAARRFDTRKSVTQQQLGATLTHDFTPAMQLQVIAYGGQRDITQFLAIPVAAQANPLHGGGVIELSSPYAGMDARWTRRLALPAGELEVVAGLNLERQRQDRRGYENFVGTRLGVRGALRLSQADEVRAVDPYAQLLWRLERNWTLMLGARHSDIRFRSHDRYVTAGNPDDSGRVRYRATSPVAGISWTPGPQWQWFADWGRGFETPTFNELAYRGDGGSGPNFALRPARTRSFETGLRFRRNEASTELALFRADTDDELAVATSAGGRTTFQNAGSARRQGLEWAGHLPLRPQLRGEWALTWLDARYREPFLTCATAPCTVPDTVVARGARIPGVPRINAYAAAQFGDEGGWHARIEVQHVGAVRVNMLDGEQALGYTVANVSSGFGLRRSSGEGRVFVAIGNLFDRRYAGSVIVNESNRRYYEPAPGRTLQAGFEWRWRDAP